MTSRNEQIAVERRRRNTDALSGRRVRLAVDESKLDHANYVYRWINDTGSRVYDLTKRDDWDVVTDREGELKPHDGTTAGAEVTTLGGTGADGKAERMILVRKRREYQKDDEAKKAKAIDDLESSMKAGSVPQAGVEQGYVPAEGANVRIGRGRA